MDHVPSAAAAAGDEETPAPRRIVVGRPEGGGIAAGPSSAPTFDAVVRERERALVRYAARILNDADAAQDVVQTAFLRLHEHWERLSAEPARIVPWLYRTVHNAAVDHIRREERRRRAHEESARDPALTLAAAGADSADEARRRLVERELARLSPGEREVLALRLEHGMPYRDIARVTGRTTGNVGCLLHNAVRKLAAALREGGAL